MQREVPPDVVRAYHQHLQRERDRIQRFGHVRPVIATTFDDHRFVAVGDSIHWSKGWRTFPDFLLDYIKTALGAEWGHAEQQKPVADQHVIIQWCAAVGELNRRAQRESDPVDGIYTSVLDGPSRAYFLLAYDLYVLRDHIALQDAVVRRLKHPDQFQGARYELFVAATMIRAGCDIEYEDESDTTRRHPEFVATHKSTGQRVAVEAKSRHRPGVLGRSGAASTATPFRLGIQPLVRDAFGKTGDDPYVIFVDANMPPEVASPFSAVDWRRQVHEAVLAEDRDVKTDAGIYVGSCFNMLIVTNTPDHYGSPGATSPPYAFYHLKPNLPARELRDPSLIKEIERALSQYGNLPQDLSDQ